MSSPQAPGAVGDDAARRGSTSRSTGGGQVGTARHAASAPAPASAPASTSASTTASASGSSTPAGSPAQPGDAEGVDSAPTTVLPDGRSAPSGTAGSALPTRRAPQRPSAREPRGTPAPRPASKTRRARLALQRIDPWSVFLYSLVSSVFLGVALVVAVFVLYAVLDRLGVPDTVNELFLELTGGDAASEPLLTSGRFVGAATVLAAVNVVLITLLSTLGALLYNLCASFTGGIEVTLGERD